MELQVLQDKVDSWIKNYGVRYFDILTNMAQLTEEVGEVARIISRRYGEQSEKNKNYKQLFFYKNPDILSSPHPKESLGFARTSLVLPSLLWTNKEEEGQILHL